MGLMQVAQASVKRIVTDTAGFGVPMTFEVPAISAAIVRTANVNGLHTKINHFVNTDGEVLLAKKAYCSVSESSLTDLGYVTRDPVTDEVKLKGHKVSATDSSGKLWVYIIREVYPDERLGLIVCIFGDFE